MDRVHEVDWAHYASIFDQLWQYGRLMRIDKPIGTLLLLWPALWALWVAGEGHPHPWVFSVFVVGAFLMRSAGCVINDYADRNIDPLVARTKNRPLASGRVSSEEALLLAAGLSLIALGLVLSLNRQTILWAFGGGFLAASYPFVKRITFFPQFYLGIAFAWSIPMAFAAQTGVVSRVTGLLFIGAMLWTVAYDTIYAMVDREDDKRIGVKSTAIVFADLDRFWTGIMQLMSVLAFYLAGRLLEFGIWYRLALAITAMLFLYQQILIRNRKPDDCFNAFLNNRHVGMVIFIGILLEYAFVTAKVAG